MYTILDKMASAGILTDEQVERVGTRVSGLMKESATLPEGFWGKTWSLTREALPATIGASVATAITAMGLDALKAGVKVPVKAISESVRKRSGFKSMLEQHPDLKERGDTARLYYNTLFDFNPDYAKNPLVAGQYVRQTMDQEGLHLPSLKNVIDAHKSIQDANKPSDFGKSMVQGMPAGKLLDFDPNKAQRDLEEHAEKMQDYGRRGLEGSFREEDRPINRLFLQQKYQAALNDATKKYEKAKDRWEAVGTPENRQKMEMRHAEWVALRKQKV